MKKSRKKVIILIIVPVILLLLTGGWWAFSVSIYNDNFNKRFTSYEPLMFRLEDFNGIPALKRKKYEFPSDKGQKLTGYLYSTECEQRGIIVLAHGFGAGHNSYMDCAYFFAQRGYYVFAYDATGNDESEGEGVGGIPQGVADLDHAISFVEESTEIPDLPIVLFGHSWGGYSACAVLQYHPEVKAVIECAGCNRSTDLFEAGGLKQAGNLIYTMLPFVRLHEKIKFGKYASATALDGFAASDAAVMVVHSEDDEVVPIRYGYDVFFKKYEMNPRFIFNRMSDRGHNYIFNDRTYIDEFNAEFDKWRDQLDYDVNAEENAERFQNDRADYIREHLDRARWCNSLDNYLFNNFLSFYDAHIGD